MPARRKAISIFLLEENNIINYELQMKSLYELFVRREKKATTVELVQNPCVYLKFDNLNYVALFKQARNIVVVLYKTRLLFDISTKMEDIVALVAPQVTKPFGERIMTLSCNFRNESTDVSCSDLSEKLLEACRQMMLLKEVAMPMKKV